MNGQSILVDEEVFSELQNLAVPLVDDANSVLRRVLNLAPIGTDATSLRGVSVPSRTEEPPPSATRESSPQNRHPRAGSSKGKRRPARAPAGTLLPEVEYELPLLESLVELGGSGPTSQVIDRLGEKLGDKLSDGDRQTISSGDVRWRNRVQFVRLGLIKEGHMLKDSPRGVWEISEAGRERVSRQSEAGE